MAKDGSPQDDDRYSFLNDLPTTPVGRAKAEVAGRLLNLSALAAQIEGDLRLPQEFRDIFVTLCRAGFPTVVPLLSAALVLHDRPYSLENHFAFEPMFRTNAAAIQAWICARQVAKSQSLAAASVMTAASIPAFHILFITPLYEQSRRFSHNYVKPLLDRGPLAGIMTPDEKFGSVLQRNFHNGSRMQFSYAKYDADRTRGIPASRLCVDEVQDMYSEVLPILDKVLSGAASWRQRVYAGTPKSFDNAAQIAWEDGSQAEWVIPCTKGGCNHWNVPRTDADLRKMVGPYNRDISRRNPGLRCARCTGPLDPRLGHWWHAYPDKRGQYESFHVPQHILPHHCEDPEAWFELVEAHEGRQHHTEASYLNEVCGESCDTESKVVTEAQLKAACTLPWKRKFEEAVRRVKDYSLVVLAVDWGGGGGTVQGERSKPTRKSFTTLAVLGTNGGGYVDVLWGVRSKDTHDHAKEARLVRDAFRKFRCRFIVHDFGGEGKVRESLLVGGGVPRERIVPVAYHGPSRAPIVKHAPSVSQPRHWWGLDKAFALGTLCEGIKHGLIRFFEFDKASSREPGLVCDFLALYEERFTSLPTNDLFRIDSIKTQPDDFAQACCIGASVLWELTQSWPSDGRAKKYKAPDHLFDYVEAAPEADWLAI